MKKKMAVAAAVLCLMQAAEARGVSYDPYEGYNRVMFKVNNKVDHYVLSPVARGYRKITPSPVRTGVRNFFNNLRDVVSLGSNLLRLDIEKAATDFTRIGLNTTFGLGGLIDIAGAGGIPSYKSTPGDTLASWGWKNSNYFVYPLIGPSTVRDSLGSTVVYVYPVQNAVFHNTGMRWGVAGVHGISARESFLDVTDSLDSAALDPYSYTRDAYMEMRNKQVGGTLIKDDDDIDIDSLVPAGSDTQAVSEPADPQTATPAAETDTAFTAGTDAASSVGNIKSAVTAAPDVGATPSESEAVETTGTEAAASAVAAQDASSAVPAKQVSQKHGKKRLKAVY